MTKSKKPHSLVRKGEHWFCPTCKMFTEQLRIAHGVRKCCGCGREFTSKDAKAARLAAGVKFPGEN